MAFPIITDPNFYLVAVPAVLLLGVSKSGFGAGFGLLAVPLMALAVPVPAAAAILMPVLLVMDLLGLAAFRRDFFDRTLLAFMIPCGLLGTVIGALLFRMLSAMRWPASSACSRCCSWRSGWCFRPGRAIRCRRGRWAAC